MARGTSKAKPHRISERYLDTALDPGSVMVLMSQSKGLWNNLVHNSNFQGGFMAGTEAFSQILVWVPLMLENAHTHPSPLRWSPGTMTVLPALCILTHQVFLS